MKAIINSILLILLCITIFSCAYQKPIASTSPKNNKTYKVEYLFEHDGCKVYRFMDNGNYVYFTNCRGEVTSIVNDSTSVHIKTMTNE